MGQSRRHISSRTKFRIVMEVLVDRRAPGVVAKAYGVRPASIGLWKRTLMERGHEVFESRGRRGPERWILDFERLLRS